MMSTLARRLMRSAWARRPVPVVAVAVAAVVLAHTIATAWSLTAPQVADRELGRFSGLVLTGAAVSPGDVEALGTITSVVESSTAQPLLVSRDVTPVGEETRDWIYRETDFTTEPYPSLDLRSGRWPREAGEVVLAGDAPASAGGTLAVAGGAVSLTVVGRADDPYSSAPTLLAAAGTFASLPLEALRGSDRLSATISVLTDGDPVEVANQLSAVGVPAEGLDRGQIDAERSWVSLSPFAVIVPALLVPLMAAAAAVGSSSGRLGRYLARVRSVGASRSTAVGSAVLASLAMSLLGVLVGLGMAAAFTPVVRWSMGGLSSTVLATYRLPSLVAALAAAGALVGAVSAVITIAATSTTRSRSATGDPTRAATRSARIARARQVLAGASAVFAVLVGAQVTTLGGAMTVGAIVLLGWAMLMPEQIRLVARGLDRSGRAPSPVASRLAARMLAAPGGGTAFGAVLLGVLVTLPLTSGIALTATGAAERNSLLADVGPGQLGVFRAADGVASPSPAVEQLVESSLPRSVAASGVTIGVATNAWYDVADGNALVAVVASVQEIERVWGQPLTDRQRATVTGGGVLVWQPGADVLVDDQPVGVDQARYVPSEEWQVRTGAVMLQSTADQLGVDVQPGARVFIGVGPTLAADLIDDVRDSGLDVSAVHVYRSPAEPVPPAPLVAGAVLLTVLLGLSAVGATRGYVRGARQVHARLHAVGAPDRFLRRTALTGSLALLGTGVLGAVTVSAITLMTAQWAIADVEYRPPWGLIAAVLLATVVAVTAATARAVVAVTAPAS